MEIRFEDYQALCRKSAWAYHRKYPLVPYDDMEAEAFFLFVRARDSFDSERGVRFSTHLHVTLQNLNWYGKQGYRVGIAEELDLDEDTVFYDEVSNEFGLALAELSSDAKVVAERILQNDFGRKPSFSSLLSVFLDHGWTRKRFTNAWNALERELVPCLM